MARSSATPNYFRRAVALGLFGLFLLGLGMYRAIFRAEWLLVPLLFGALFLIVALVNARIYVVQQHGQKTPDSDL